MKRIFVFAALAALEAAAGSLYVECESFRDLGGWIVDPHSMRQIGSSYVMTHYGLHRLAWAEVRRNRKRY